MNVSSAVRPPAVAGLFYPADPKILVRQIDDFLKRATSDPLRMGSGKGHLLALVSPHAGFMYSGLTAAHAYKLLKERRFDTAVIVSPSHREYFDGISIFGGAAYRTPLGEVPIDAAFRDALVEDDTLIALSDAGHGQEHAIEVQIPFLQKMLGGCRIVPIVMGDQRREYCFHLGKKLAQVARGKNVLLIASTDLSHYYPYDTAQLLDNIIIDEVQRLDYEQLMADLETERAEACGGGPTVAVLLAACDLGANKAYILHACNSGDVTGDKGGVVGYLSAAILQINPDEIGVN
jgi:AmmeMemoRadiSam system protein B